MADCAKAGTGSSRPCQKRYVSSNRALYNRLRRAERHKKRVAYFEARRAAGKRNAYLDARGGRDHHGQREAA